MSSEKDLGIIQDRDWRDNFAGFFGQRADQVIPGRKPDAGGQSVSAGFGDWVWGRDTQELTSAYNINKSDNLRTKYKGQLEQLNGTWRDDMSEGEALSEIQRLTDQRNDDRFPNTPAGRAYEREGDQLNLTNKRIDNQNNITNKRLDAQLALSTQQMNNQNNALIMQMRDNQQSRSFDRESSEANRMLTLQLANMNADLQDKRLAYDKETRRMDKRDRAIAQLMSGLGQLGGAFAL